jgi:hypothetical protein
MKPGNETSFADHFRAYMCLASTTSEVAGTLAARLSQYVGDWMGQNDA